MYACMEVDCRAAPVSRTTHLQPSQDVALAEVHPTATAAGASFTSGLCAPALSWGAGQSRGGPDGSDLKVEEGEGQAH